MKQWYEILFENYGEKYDKEPFIGGTAGECDFIEDEAAHDRTRRILDIGCGTGRHTIELAKRGYRVMGIDLSESMLERAKQKASGEGVNVDFRKADARTLAYSKEFDIVIMLCEGGFPLMETDEMNFEILASAAKSLKDGGRFIFTTLNGFFPLFHSVKEFIDSNAKEGTASCEELNFDIMTLRDHSTTRFVNDLGETRELECNERYYLPSEITWLLKSLGFGKVDIFQAKLGEFSRSKRLTTEDFEMLVVAVK
ncbi:MAG: class I SAM-dependent methyltransferase [Bacteroidetes bacterium]|nr:class I SAM-dependent methyltransferase [Bacteroidota bacterium]